MVVCKNGPWGQCLFILLFTWLSIVPDTLGGSISSSKSFKDEIQPNTSLARDLSNRLETPVVVYDTNWFYVIALEAYEKEVKETVAPNVVEAVAEFRNLFHFGKDEKPPWKGGEKGSLVLLKDRASYRKYLEIFEKAAQPERLNPDFLDEVENAQSFYWIEPQPYAVCCGEKAEWREMVQHLFHLLGHILLTEFEFNHKFAPPWLHEGFGAYMAIRYAGSNILYCTKGLNHCLFGTGVYKDLSAWARSENWPELLSRKELDDSVLKLHKLHSYALSDFIHQDVALSWSFVAYLVQKHPDELRTYVKTLKAQPRELAPDCEWPPEEFSLKVFKNAFGMDFQEIEPLYKAWTEKELARATQAPVRSKNRHGYGSVSFDPAYHLADFTRFEGEEVGDALDPFLKRTDEWMSPESLERVLTEWSKVRSRLLAELDRRKSQILPGTEVLFERLASDSCSRYLDDSALLALIRSGKSEDVVCPVVRYLVEESGCQGAHSRIKTMVEGMTEKLEVDNLADELCLLRDAARYEERLLDALVEAEAATHIDCWQGKVRLVDATDGQLIFTGKKMKGGILPNSMDSQRIQIKEREKDVEILYPLARFDVSTLVKLGKSTLRWKSNEDRYGYALLHLFQGDVAALRSELRFLKGRGEEKERLNAHVRQYDRAGSASALLRFLTGSIKGDPKDHIKPLATLMADMKGSNLHKQLKSSLTPILQRWLLENYLQENHYLRSFKGFRSINSSTGEAHFLYEFNDPGEIEDFDTGESHLGNALKVRYKADKSIGAERFHVNKGSLSCYGLDFISIKPVFTGDIELAIHLKVVRRKKKDTKDYFYCMFGYGLNSTGAYVGASCLTHLEVQTSVHGKYKLLQAYDAEKAVGSERSCPIVLKGSTDRIVYRYDALEEKVFSLKGQRTGQVFMWVYGPKQFEIERIEIQSKIDPDWFIANLECKISKDLERILETR